jgi:natural product biosynthesis luciferase-like monooxygenase protein
MSSTNAVFAGSGSLLVRCAQAWRDAGHDIAFIATGNPDIARWAQDNGVPHVANASELPQDIAFDYLFSVANLQVLPASLTGRARKLAINFHDGPLPRYAGLNATSWALMAREPEHGITWHEMTERVDAGRVVRQKLFPLAQAETALSLNARCYEAGLAAFVEIAQDAARGELPLSPQSGARSFFARDRRPPALGTIDFARPARDIVALVRALDYGNYANPLAHAKFLWGDRMVVAREARETGTLSGAAAGTVLAVRDAGIEVATGQGDVALSALTEIDGSPIRAIPACGERLPLLDARLLDKLETLTPSIARGERHWTAALPQVAPVELPWARKRGGDSQPHHIALDAPRTRRTAAAFVAWLAAVAGQERVSVLVDISPAQDALEPWLQPWVPLNAQFSPDTPLHEAMRHVEEQLAATQAAGPYPRDLVTRLGDKHAPVGQVSVAMSAHTTQLPADVDLMLAHNKDRLALVADGHAFSLATAQAIAAQLSHWLAQFDADAGKQADRPLAALDLVPTGDARRFTAFNETGVEFDGASGVHDAIAAQAKRTPHRVAIEFGDRTLTYAQLDELATAWARWLVDQGVKPGDIVGLNLPRTPELMVAQLAAMKAGAAYLPLDPEYPQDRIAFMIEDSGSKLVLREAPPATSSQTPLPASDPRRAAYVIYTSGSTGKPKGVVVTHRNVMNFFAGMDARVAHDESGRWLAVTSLSFDISVLELCWTLARGFTVVLHSNVLQGESKTPDFSLFYFASDHASTPADRYRVLMEGAKFADDNGFSAVWTPERHFHAFGGLYPNPAVTSAAIAACTSRIQIRAGSCVLPLHHPIRVAEEWAFVDNISQGRVGISFASGWQPNDFVIAPQAFANRKSEMLANIDVVRRLWRGERLPFPGPNGNMVEVQTLPRPIQKELPVWVTAAGNPETFEQAGALGCHLLTHLLGQKIEDVAEKLKLYRAAWRKAGHAGNPHVTLMLHTFVGDDDDEVRATVRQPMKDYLRSSVDLIRQAAWSFPTFVQRAAQDGKNPVQVMEAQPLSDEEMDALLEHAFNRYYGTSALFGTADRCLAMIDKLRDAGVDEIACLIDFGIPTQTVLDHLHHLKALMDAARELRPVAQRVSLAQQILSRHVTHLQCTPSMASMLVADAEGRAALTTLESMMVGGEALPLKLATQLRELLPGQLLNMYGPTETTIWSTTCELREVGEFVPLGEPIANTRLRVRNAWGMDAPSLVAGELLIGGAGVAQGYLHRPELTAERFIDSDGERWYRTGDLVRRRADGAIEFLGRIDHQVKIRGHRIELGEIESVLARQPGVKDSVVVARDDRLLGYVTLHAGGRADAAQLRAALAKELPEVMVPQAVLVLPSLPMTPNGKIDRRALPEPNTVIAARPAESAPQGEMERAVAAIWQDVLGLPQVGTTDNFFDLGGHSLLVVQVQRRLRETCGREVSITDMFRLPTIKALAAHLSGSEPQANAVNDGLARAQARRMMRSRTTANA